MKTFAEYVEQIKEKYSVSSSYAVAKMLGINPKLIGEMIDGTRNVPLIARSRIADLLEIDPTEVISSLEWQREKDEEVKDYWKSVFFRHCRAASMAGLVAAMLSAVPVDVKAGGIEKHSDMTRNLSESQIMRTARRQKRRRKQGLERLPFFLPLLQLAKRFIARQNRHHLHFHRV